MSLYSVIQAFFSSCPFRLRYSRNYHTGETTLGGVGVVVKPEGWGSGKRVMHAGAKESKILQVCVRENQRLAGNTGWASLIWSAWDHRCFTQWSFLSLKHLHTHTLWNILEMGHMSKPGIHSCFIIHYTCRQKVILQCHLYPFILSLSLCMRMEFSVCSVTLMLETFWIECLDFLARSNQFASSRIQRSGPVELSGSQIIISVDGIILELYRLLRNVPCRKVACVTDIRHVGHQNCCFEHLMPN